MTIGHLRINRAARRFNSLATQALATDGLTFLEGLVLTAIFFEAPTPLKPSELAETFGLPKSDAAKIVREIESHVGIVASVPEGFQFICGSDIAYLFFLKQSYFY